jgi:hypothetical protein
VRDVLHGMLVVQEASLEQSFLLLETGWWFSPKASRHLEFVKHAWLRLEENRSMACCEATGLSLSLYIYIYMIEFTNVHVVVFN